MLFKRRKPPSFGETVRVWLWPRRSWLRSTQYVTKRILRLTATPHAIAAGVAAGVFTSFSPLMGLHFLLAFIIAWLLRGNLIASALGTFFGNPLTFPFIWAATFKTGGWIVGGGHSHEAAMAIGDSMKSILVALFSLDLRVAWQGIVTIWEPVIYPMLVGGLLLGPLFAIPVYWITRRATGLFRENRRNKLLEKAAAARARAREASQLGKKMGGGAGQLS